MPLACENNRRGRCAIGICCAIAVLLSGAPGQAQGTSPSQGGNAGTFGRDNTAVDNSMRSAEPIMAPQPIQGGPADLANPLQPGLGQEDSISTDHVLGARASSAPASTTVAPGTALIDLPSAMRLAGSQNPTLAIAYQRTLAATASQQLAAARLLPNLNGGTNFDGHSGVLQQSSGNILNVHRDALYIGAGAGAVAAGTVSIPGVQYNLNLSDSIFNYLAMRAGTDRAQAMNRAAINEIQRQVALAYGELLRAEGLKAIIWQIRDDTAEVARVTAAFARVGQGLPSDADRAATELERRDALLVQADADVAIASARLVQLLNLQVPGRLHAAEPWVVPRSIVPDPIPLPELIATAVFQRPELAAERASVNGALIALRGAKVLPFSPQIMAGYSSGSFGGGSNLVASLTPPKGADPDSPRFGDFAPRTDLDVIMYWTLQNMGLGNHALIKGAAARFKQADLQRLVVLNQVRREVAEAFARKRARLAVLDIDRRAVETSLTAFQEDLNRTRSAEGHPIEVLDSLRLLDRARMTYLNAIVDYNEAQFDLFWAIGQPPADLLVRPATAAAGQPAAAAAENPL